MGARALAINRDKVLASAIKLLQGGKFEKAIAEFQKLVEDDPKDVRTILKIGDTHVKMGHREEAIKNYERVATIYSEQGFYLKAVAVFKQMLRVDSNLPDVHLKLAEMYQQLGLISDSLQHYQQVAVFYEQSGKQKDTLQILKRMVDLDPDNLPSRIKLAELFAQQGQQEDAVSEFRSAASYLKEHERFDDFIRVAERLIYFDPSAIDVTRELSQLYLQRGEAKLALGKLQVCFKADPRNLDTLTLIAQAFLEMQQVPKTISVYKEMARIHEGSGAQDDAKHMWNKVLELDAADDEAKQALSGASRAPDASVAQAAVAVADPDAEQIGRLLTETDVYVKYGLKEKAIEHLHRIFALRPDHLEGHDKLRAIYQSMGNRDALATELRTLVRLGEAAQDPRVATWRRDLDTLASAKPAARPAPAPVIEEDELLLVEDPDDLIVDPELGDELALRGAGGRELPPDLDLSQMDELSIDEEFPDDAILSDEGEVPADLSAEEDMIVPAGELGEVSGFAEASLGFEEYDAVESFDGDLHAPAPFDASAEGISLEDADALVQEALKGMEDLSGEGLAFPEEPSFIPIGSDEVIEASDALPDGFSAAPSPLDDADNPLGATAVMSLSSDEMDEINRFISQSDSLPLADAQDFESFASGESVTQGVPPGGVSGIDFDEAAAGFDSGDGLADATVNTGGMAAQRRITEDRPADPSPLLTEPESHMLGSDELDLDQVAAAAAAGLEGMDASEFASMGFGDGLAGGAAQAALEQSALDEAALDEAAAGVPAAPKNLGVSDAAYGFEDDPALQFFAEEIEEAEFFIRQELLDEAREILSEIIDDVPESARAQWMLARIDAKENDQPEPPAPWAERIIGEVAEEIGDLLAEEAFPPEATDQVSALEVLSAFKKGVKEVVRDDDADTHYNLGIAYREMGLLDDAIAEFRMSAESTAMKADSLHLIGIVQREQAKFDDSLATFDGVLALDVATEAQRAVAHYERGVSLEGLGRLGEARGAFEQARDLGAQMGDLEARLQKLQGHAGNGASHDVGFSPADDDGAGARRKNIDYV